MLDVFWHLSFIRLSRQCNIIDCNLNIIEISSTDSINATVDTTKKAAEDAKEKARVAAEAAKEEARKAAEAAKEEAKRAASK